MSKKSTKALAGQRFGRWTVIEFVPRAGDSAWACRCDCGVDRIVSQANLVSKKSVSCGCYCKDAVAERTRTHGQSERPEYVIWQAMLQRCFSPKAISYPNYGGRGITVCERWRESFEAFLADMGDRPSSAHSIDRKDNNGPYEPGNCRWATRKQQGRNTSRNRLVTYEGRTQTVVEWAEEVGMKWSTLYNRLFTNNWSVHAALTRPVIQRASRQQSA